MTIEMQTKDKSTLLTFNISSLHLQSTVHIAAGQYYSLYKVGNHKIVESFELGYPKSVKIHQKLNEVILSVWMWWCTPVNPGTLTVEERRLKESS